MNVSFTDLKITIFSDLWYKQGSLLKNGVTVIPITWLLHRFHKGQLIGILYIIVGIGSFVYALPHFISEPYEDRFEALGLYSGNFTAKARDFERIEYVYWIWTDCPSEGNTYDFLLSQSKISMWLKPFLRMTGTSV